MGFFFELGFGGRIHFVPSRLHRYYGLNHLHFITCSCNQRVPALADPQHRTLFVRTLGAIRTRYRFALVGYVVMPEHFHLLMSEPAVGNPSVVMQVLKQTFSRHILGTLRRKTPTLCSAKDGAPRDSSAKRLLRRLEHQADPGEFQFWQRRFYDFNVWSEKKRIEKLHYMHNNPVERRLVKHPGDWPWSSFRFYEYGDARMLTMDFITQK